MSFHYNEHPQYWNPTLINTTMTELNWDYKKARRMSDQFSQSPRNPPRWSSHQESADFIIAMNGRMPHKDRSLPPDLFPKSSTSLEINATAFQKDFQLGRNQALVRPASPSAFESENISLNSNNARLFSMTKPTIPVLANASGAPISRLFSPDLILAKDNPFPIFFSSIFVFGLSRSNFYERQLLFIYSEITIHPFFILDVEKIGYCFFIFITNSKTAR